MARKSPDSTPLICTSPPTATGRTSSTECGLKASRTPRTCPPGNTAWNNDDALEGGEEWNNHYRKKTNYQVESVPVEELLHPLRPEGLVRARQALDVDLGRKRRCSSSFSIPLPLLLLLLRSEVCVLLPHLLPQHQLHKPLPAIGAARHAFGLDFGALIRIRRRTALLVEFTLRTHSIV